MFESFFVLLLFLQKPLYRIFPFAEFSTCFLMRTLSLFLNIRPILIKMILKWCIVTSDITFKLSAKLFQIPKFAISFARELTFWTLYSIRLFSEPSNEHLSPMMTWRVRNLQIALATQLAQVHYSQWDTKITVRLPTELDPAKSLFCTSPVPVLG